MKEKFQELKTAVIKLEDPIASAIIDLLEDYNKGLSRYFCNREISRDFMLNFDLRLTMEAVNKKFNVDCDSDMGLQQLAIDLNTLARSTWYFERDNGTILTGDHLYKMKAVYMASYTEKEPFYESEEDKKEAEELWDYVESRAYFGDEDKIPKPIGYKEVIKDVEGEENASTVEDMVDLIKLHCLLNRKPLLTGCAILEYKKQNLELQKEKLNFFWKKFFDLEIDWDKIKIPSIESVGEVSLNDGPFEKALFQKMETVLEFIPKGLTYQKVLEAYERFFTDDNDHDLSPFFRETLKNKIVSFEKREDDDYVIRHFGIKNPDIGIFYNNRQYSYDLFKSVDKNIHLMTELEYFIAYFRFRVETGSRYDTQGSITKFNSEIFYPDFTTQLNAYRFFNRWKPGYTICGNGLRISDKPYIFYPLNFRQVFL